jgi:predicted MPP superfamily phosphohydrolase
LYIFWMLGDAAAAMRTLADMLPVWLLYVGACLGHAFLLTIALNVIYGNALPRRVLKVTRKIDILVILGGPLLFLYALDLLGSRQLSWDFGTLRGWLAPYTVICVVAGFVIGPIAQLLYWLRRTPPHQVECRGRVVDVMAALGYAPCGIVRESRKCLWPFNQVFQVEFTHKTLALPQLPAAWDGLTILHLTDLHLCGTPDRAFHQYVIDAGMRDGVPDLVMLTGDVVDSSWHHRWILPVLGRLDWNIEAFAILGNHDAWFDVQAIRRRLGRAGMTVLGNSWRQIDVRGAPMIVIGNETPWFKPAPDLAGCPPDVFRLCLSHTPDTMPWARRNRIDLVLAGHVHGGQIRFPILGATFVPSRFSRRYDCGTFYEAPTLMHVGRGLGGQHPMRILCRPEVTRIMLKKA